MGGKKPVAESHPATTVKRLVELPAVLDSLPRLSECEAKELVGDLAGAREALDQARVTEAQRSMRRYPGDMFPIRRWNGTH